MASGMAVLSGSFSWVDDQYVTVFNDDIETIDSYHQLSARLAWRPASERFVVALYGLNLTDEVSFANDFSVSALADGVRRTGTPINPRTYGIEAAVFF